MGLNSGGRRRLALLVGQPEEYCQEEFIKGFSGRMLKENFDICVFAMFRKFQDSPSREKGESNIYSLIDLDSFDGICIMADSIQTPGVVESLTETLEKEYKGTVLFVEKEVEGFPYVLQDNYTPIKKMISHLIEKHGYKDIAYLTGKSWHAHSKKRLQAYRDCMAEHGLEVREDRVFYGDFWYTSGENTAEKLIRSGDLPEAVACANDCMALGLAKTFIARGIRVPEDVAVMGYDCNEEGMHAPIPITSAPLPFESFGEYSADAMLNLMAGKEIQPFEADVEMFIGKTCGCDGDSMKAVYEVRPEWDTAISENSFTSVFSGFNEDMMLQTAFRGLLTTIYSYVYQIGNYDTFTVCLNEGWMMSRTTYTARILRAIDCNRTDDSKDSVELDEFFDKSVMLPALLEKCDKPRLFYFLPLFFEDESLGYAALGFVDRYCPFSAGVRVWLRSVMFGLEAFRRSSELDSSRKLVEMGTNFDALTGLPNYKGMLNSVDSLMERIREAGGYVDVIAYDIRGLAQFNDLRGRDAGDRVIVGISTTLQSVFNSADCYSCYTGSGEFVVMYFSALENGETFKRYCEEFKEAMKVFNADPDVISQTELYHGHESGHPENAAALERIVNVAISRKNGFKFGSRFKKDYSVLDEDEVKLAGRVMEVLDNNKFNYHFQPIISSANGDIYAYEALMRPDTEPYIAPPVVLKYADFLDRLYDVEKATFVNVLNRLAKEPVFMENNRKVFINSIPGEHLKGDELEFVESSIRKFAGNIVIELTEQTELSDEELAEVKAVYANMGAGTAVDDYGTGYSNVVNLLRYMPDYVKIDRSLITDIQNSPQKQHFVKDIISFSHDNGILALAEGVETHDELKTAIKLGADLIQGYYTARPSAELLADTPDDIRREIVELKKSALSSSVGVYIPGRDGRVLLSKLEEEGTERISVSRKEMTFIDFTVAGAPGIKSPVTIEVLNGYHGTITLENCGLGFSESESYGISVAEGCAVTLVLTGHNYLKGGIYVAKGGLLNIEGDGTIEIQGKYDDCFGIGAGTDRECGSIVIDTAGVISIRSKSNGGAAIGIGAGLGAEKLEIKHGKYEMQIRGESVVAIGALSSDDQKLKISESVINFELQGEKLCGIGCLSGRAEMEFDHSQISFSVCGDGVLMGSMDGSSILSENECSIAHTVECGDIVVYGVAGRE